MLAKSNILPGGNRHWNVILVITHRVREPFEAFSNFLKGHMTLKTDDDVGTIALLVWGKTKEFADDQSCRNGKNLSHIGIYEYNFIKLIESTANNYNLER